MTIRSVLIVFTAALLFGCATEKKKEPAVEERSNEQIAATEEDSGAQTFGAGEEDASSIGSLDELKKNELSVRVFYFEYDSSTIRAEYRPAIAAHAEYLAANSKVSVTLEGHADERGSREYNLALGELRAQSVKRQMVLLGASSGQIKLLSYGEERPAVGGHDEGSWQQNRRVEILY